MRLWYRCLLIILVLCSLLTFSHRTTDELRGERQQIKPDHASPSVPLLQENSNLYSGTGVRAHWNLTEIFRSQGNAFDAVLADVDGDGGLEVIFSKDARCEFICMGLDDEVVWHTPILSLATPGYYGGEVVDLDGDGNLEYIAAADSIWVLDAATGAVKWQVSDIGSAPSEAPWTLAHISSTDLWDVVVARAYEDQFVVSVFDSFGTLLWQRAIEEATYGHTLMARDVDGDDYDEVFVACSRQTVALDSSGVIRWVAPLDVSVKDQSEEYLQAHGLNPLPGLMQVDHWWLHSDFVEVAQLYDDGDYYVLHDYGGGRLDTTLIQILDARTGLVIADFESAGHHQWLRVADLQPDLPGQEIVYVTREEVVMRGSNLEILWQHPLSGAHQLALGDWNADGRADIMVATNFRGLERFASIDSSFVVYDAWGNVLYNMLFRYPELGGSGATLQMQTALRKVQDHDGDGGVEIPVSFSYHDAGNFLSTQDVHLYILGMTDTHYHNEFLSYPNQSTATMSGTMFLDGALQLQRAVPETPYVEPLPEAVLLLLHMDEQQGDLIYDNSAFAHHGVLLQGERKPGRFGNGVDLSLPGDRAQIPFSEYLNVPTLSMDMWVNVTSTATTQVLVGRPWAYELRITEAGELSFYIYDPDATPRWKSPHVEAPFGKFDRPVHIAATYDGVWLRLYIDGQEVDAESHVGAINTVLTSALLVGNNTRGTAPLGGTIDELRLVSGVLPSPVRPSGTWTSQPITLSPSGSWSSIVGIEQQLMGGTVVYEFTDLIGNPLSVQVLGDFYIFEALSEPLVVHARLERGIDPCASPRVSHISTADLHQVWLPLTMRALCCPENSASIELLQKEDHLH